MILKPEVKSYNLENNLVSSITNRSEDKAEKGNVFFAGFWFTSFVYATSQVTQQKYDSWI